MIDKRLPRTCCFSEDVHLAIPTVTTTGRDLLAGGVAGKQTNPATELMRREGPKCNVQNTPEQCFQMERALLLFFK